MNIADLCAEVFAVLGTSQYTHVISSMNSYFRIDLAFNDRSDGERRPCLSASCYTPQEKSRNEEARISCARSLCVEE